MRAQNKTKAALQGRLSHFSNVTEENNTAISLVNLSRSAGAGNYGKSPQRLTVGGISRSVTATMPRLLSGGVRHWRSAQSPKFSGDLQSAENSADTRLAEKPADRKIWLGFEPQIPTKGIPSLEQNHRLISQPFGSSLACLRWRRLISPFTAVTINCAFVSPSTRLLSKSATTSCGKRALSCCDLLLVEPVAITESPDDRCDSVYANKMIIKDLKCDSLGSNFKSEGAIHLVSAKPGSARTLTGPLTKPLFEVTVMADIQSTQTHPKFTWRFLALGVSTRNVIHITAPTEREARDLSPAGFVMVFAGRLPVQEVSHA